MNVNREGDSTITINLTNDEAGFLLNVLGMVSDCTKAEPLDGLFDLLASRHVDPVGTITIEENPMHEHYPEDEPSHNIVVEDA